MELFKQRLRFQTEKQDWHRQIDNSTKAHYYRYFMTELTVAIYIYYNLPLKIELHYLD